MDHLPVVTNPYEPIDILYLGGKEYDGHSFVEYPERQGWHVNNLLQGDLQGRTTIEAAQFFQTWLYFGMLHEALSSNEGERVQLADFVRIDERSKQNFITTKRLPQLMESWQHRIKDMADAKTYYDRFRNSMRVACGAWRDLMEASFQKNTNQLLSHEILLSIQILGAALDIGITEVVGSRTDYTWRTVPRSTWLMQRMIRQGWCPSVVEQISKPDASFLYYASLLGPPKRGSDHSSCSATDKACLATTVKAGVPYVTKHATEGCSCDSVTIPTQDGSPVASAIDRGDIPIIHLRDDGGELVVDIVAHKPSEPISYIAISHVWSDGLGDLEGNSLPQCQLKRLGTLLRTLPAYPEAEETVNDLKIPATESADISDYYFWMDTLCVPANNPKLRARAIVKMRDVYKSASKVLVLDAELMKSSCVCPYQEIFARISCSSWLRRLWTLQEATLNRNVLFQFAERALYVGNKSVLARFQSYENKKKPWDLVTWECARYDFNWLNDFQYLSNSARINVVWDNIGNRITSRSGDEPLCIAILLDLDVAELQKSPDACTVKKFWSLHTNGLPASVLFLPGRKLPDKGFGWAPANLTDLKITGGDINASGEVTSQGLRVSYPGFALSQIEDPVSCIITCKIGSETFIIRRKMDNGGLPWDDLNLQKRKNLAVILMVVTGSDELDGSKIESALGVLVECQRDMDDNEKYVKYLRFVSVIKRGDFNDRHPNQAWSSKEIEEKNQTPVAVTYLPRGQKWCVG